MESFCTLKPKEALISVTSFNVGNSIPAIESSYLDNVKKFRLAGLNDLIAAKGKVTQEVSDAKYQTGRRKEESQKADIAIILSAPSSATILQSVTRYSSSTLSNQHR